MPTAEELCRAADLLAANGKYLAALTEYSRAIQIAPQLPQPYYSAGCAALSLNEFVAAQQCFAKAVDLSPDWLEARHNWARSLYELGEVDQAVEEFRRCADMPRAGREHSMAMQAVIIPGALTASAQEILKVRKAWADQWAGESPLCSQGQPVAGRRIRVGYVSSFFRSDNWMKPVWGLVGQHDREQFEIYLFSDGAVTRNDEQVFDTSNLSNHDLAQLIRDRELDILVDLNGYSNMRRLPLFNLHPTPVVLGWFNLYATTGMAGFDYLIGDSTVVTPEEEVFYSEKILRVEGSYLAFEVNYPVPPVALPSTTDSEPFVFGVTASQYKITEHAIASWSRILAQATNSVLLIKNRQTKHRQTCDYILQLFEQHGVDTARIRFEAPAPHFEFLQVYDRIDVLLDTFPYNGGTTTSEAIWQGVPVLTFWGDRWASRTSASILLAGGLGEFVAPDLEGYEKMGVEMANDPLARRKLMELRREMRWRLQSSSICDTKSFARQMEGLYRYVLR